MASLYGRHWSRQEIVRHVGHMDQVAGIKLVEAADGLGRGCRMLQVWEGQGTYVLGIEPANSSGVATQ